MRGTPRNGKVAVITEAELEQRVEALAMQVQEKAATKKANLVRASELEPDQFLAESRKIADQQQKEYIRGIQRIMHDVFQEELPSPWRMAMWGSAFMAGALGALIVIVATIAGIAWAVAHWRG